MYCGRDFSPSEQAESEVFGFDFVRDLQAGDQLASAVWSLFCPQGGDTSPASKLIGSPNLVIPTGTTRVTATQQRIAGLLPDVLYTARAIVQTTLGDTKSLWAHILGIPIE